MRNWISFSCRFTIGAALVCGLAASACEAAMVETGASTSGIVDGAVARKRLCESYVQVQSELRPKGFTDAKPFDLSTLRTLVDGAADIDALWRSMNETGYPEEMSLVYATESPQEGTPEW